MQNSGCRPRFDFTRVIKSMLSHACAGIHEAAAGHSEVLCLGHPCQRSTPHLRGHVHTAVALAPSLAQEGCAQAWLRFCHMLALGLKHGGGAQLQGLDV